jgi:carboxyl-terminal processing protease
VRRLLILVLAVVLAAAACTGGEAVPTATTGTTSTTTTTVPATTSTVSADLSTVGCAGAPDAFSILCEAVAIIRDRYVDEIPAATLAAAATRGLEEFAVPDVDSAPLECALPDPAFLSFCETFDELDPAVADGVESSVEGLAFYALDPNSVYFDPEALVISEESQSGTVEGIGALVTTEDDTAEDPRGAACQLVSDTCHVVIVSALPGSPAERAGVQPGDQIVAVDGEDVIGRTFDTVTTEVRGPAGSSVTLTLRRGERDVEVTITRAAIEVPVVEGEMVGDTAYLRLNFFTNNSDAQLHDELQTLLASKPSRLVFDMRDNPGGALTAAVAIASEFLDGGLVLLTEAPEEERPYEVIPGGLATDPSLPVYVLVNRGSASASEVVTGALSEAGRATVIGEATFGKNTVQQRFGLSNGGALKLTIARWVTPSGSDFGATGIIPDIEAELPADLTPAELVARVDDLVG